MRGAVSMLAVDELTMKEFLDHWGMEHLPFPKTVDPAQLFLNERFQRALRQLMHPLNTREIAVVIGEAGSGKTSLLDLLMSSISSTRYKIIHLPVPLNKPRELYRSIAAAMGVNTTWFGADVLKVVDLMSYSYIESNRPCLVLLDEAHLLTPATLNELRLLSNTKVKNDPILALMLFGQPTLASTLKLPAMIPLAQRIGAWINLAPFTEEECMQYIDWHLNKAGSQREVFSLAARKAIFRFSLGNPRMINRLAWECLNQGCLDGAEIITEEILAYVCKNIGPHLGN